jgi:ubiquinol-cytochrome c reductase cytochrome b subunit
VFFTGAFRKPRETNWVIGVALLTMGLGAGFAGYSLPDDLLSGTGLRIAEGIMLSIPLVGTYVSLFVFGGQFPGEEFISRLYAIHILLIPGLILALVTAHLMMVWYQKHTQFPGPGRTNDNVVGYRLMPIYMAKAGGFFFAVFGITVLISGLVTINPIWMYGPYNPAQVTAGSQPDWYIGWLEGALRMMPNVETVIFGFTISWNVLVPSVVVPGIIFTAMALYPWFESWVTGDKRDHHLLDRPRNNPTRTGIGVMALTFYILLWIGGGNDLIARFFDTSINAITWTLRVLIFVLPPIAFVITKRICLSLQRRDRDKLLHGRETGNILRLPHGEFIEIHAPISMEERAVLLSKPEVQPLALPAAEDANGVKSKKAGKERTRAKLSQWFYGDNIPLPTAAELAEADAHIAHEVEATKPILDEDAALTVGREESVLHGSPELTAAARKAASTIEGEGGPRG